jgi:hypothetical protein
MVNQTLLVLIGPVLRDFGELPKGLMRSASKHPQRLAAGLPTLLKAILSLDLNRHPTQ